MSKFHFIFLLIALNSTAFSQKKWGGMTLYTLRDEMGIDPKGTLKAVADLGYKYIEAVDSKDGLIYGFTPKEFKSYTAKLGLIPLSIHEGAITTSNADKLMESAKAAGFTYFIAPGPPMGMFRYEAITQKPMMTENLERLVRVLDTLGRKAHAAGLKFLYHNHNFEFEKNRNGIVPIDFMLEKSNPAYVNFQLDLYWTTRAGVDPVAYFQRYPDRFKIWHVKDMDDQGRFAPVGKGKIDFARILKNAKLSGMKYYIVEQDEVFDGMQPLQAIKISKEGLKNFGFK
jgi:sugar phosphate isomerase/epimerase